jgi:TrmH family RNA methyltransferase
MSQAAARLSEPPAPSDLWLALEHVCSPGNLGTLLRTSEAVGATGLVALGAGVDPWDPAVVRATMGALFTRRIVRAGARVLRAWARRHGVAIVGADGEGARDFREVSYRRPVVLVLGDERKGLSPVQRAACDELVRIPMTGRTDSLNVAVAKKTWRSVLLYEAYAQRHPLDRPTARG